MLKRHEISPLNRAVVQVRDGREQSGPNTVVACSCKRTAVQEDQIACVLVFKSQLMRYFLRILRTLLGAPGLTTRRKDATRGSWPCY